MDLVRIGRALRTIRARRGWRQQDLARRAAVSATTVGRLERGDLAASIRTLLTVATAAELRLDIRLSWRGAELDRMLNRRHAQMHAGVAMMLGRSTDWGWEGEVSFSVYGERGVIDVLAFHQPSRCLLVIELKTELVDVQEVLTVMDRRARLAPRIARERGWSATSVSTWVLLAESPTNRRRLAAHAIVMRHAFPADGRTMRRWLRRPAGSVKALSFLADRRVVTTRAEMAPISRVRRRVSRSEGLR